MRTQQKSKKNRIILLVVLFIITGALCFTAGSLLASPMQEEDADAPETEPRPRREVPPADLTTAYSLQDSFRQVADKVLPVVVEVNVIELVQQQDPRFSNPFDFFFGPGPNQDAPQEREYRRPGLGSGIIVRKDGEKVYVLTNSHVVGNADEISVGLYDGREFEAKIIGKDDRLDLSLIEFDTEEEVPVATLGDSDSLYVGDWVLAVGNPYGFESTVTAGIVSALGRRPEPTMRVSGFTDYIQTDAAINPGNSGGALVNLAGEIVGLNTWIASRSGGSVGVGFAIPINNAKKAIGDFIQTGRVEYGWLGVSIQDPVDQVLPGVAEDLGLENKEGALVVNVYQSSPAAKGGFLPGDFITAVGDTKITDSNHLTRVVGSLKPREKINFQIIRYKQPQTLSVTLETRKPEEELAQETDLWPGITPIALTDEIREQLALPEDVEGTVIGSVFPNTSAARVGMKSGDIVLAIERKEISSVLDFYRVLNGTTDREVMFRLHREGSELLLGLVK